VAKVTLCGFRRAVPYKKKTSRNSAQETQGIKGMSRHSAAHYFLEGLVDLGVEYAERGIDPTGAVVLTVRYGAKPIEFAPGKAAIAVGRKEKLISTLETVIAAGISQEDLARRSGVAKRTIARFEQNRSGVQSACPQAGHQGRSPLRTPQGGMS
jgi:hypothetical protein